MTALSHQRNVNQLNNIIQSYEKKLDQKVNEMYKHIINEPKKINEVTFPIINNKRIAQYRAPKQFRSSNHKHRAQSITSKSFIINSDVTSSLENTQADYLFKTFKSINQKNKSQKRPEVDNIQVGQLGTRSIGSKTYAKPKLIRKKPQILSKQMRWDPFYQKNAIKAQQLNQGMLNLVQRGKIGKNVDIITAFQKGRPILQTHQAIFHHLQERFTNTEAIQAQISPQKSISNKRQVYKNANPEIFRTQNNESNTLDDGLLRYNQGNSWALTMPEDHSIKTYDSKQNKINLMQEKLQIYCIYFVHYKLVQNDTYKNMKKQHSFYEQWGKVLEMIRQIQKFLKKYNIEIIYASGNKILDYVRKKQSLTKIRVNQMKQFFIKANSTFYSIKSIENKQVKRKIAVSIISSAMAFNIIRKKYINILKRKRYQNKIKQWLRNGFIIKQYRKKLQKSKQVVLKKFEQIQHNFRVNLSSIQQKKHYQIHVVNRQFMRNFKYFEQYCNTEITRLFNLENINTNIIYVSPFELNVQTINYYFKIMELEDIENYNERVTFLQLQDITSKVKFPQTLNSSQKLYFNSKALRKLKRKVEGFPAYFVTNYPTQIDINLSVYLNIPIYSGQFNKINPLRSALNSQRLLCQSIDPTPSLVVQPRKMNLFQFSNLLIRYCQSNKKYKKYIVKINNYHFSSGLALITYPFIGLPEMYKSAVLVQPYYFKSIQKYFSQLTKNGGVVQRYEQGVKTVAVCGKISPDQQHVITGTFERISSGFVNIGYLFPQKCIPHKTLAQKCRQVFNKLASLGHIGYVELTIALTLQDNIYLEEIQLYSTKITNSLYYFRFLAGGYLNHLGEFMTKVMPQGEQVQDQAISPMQSRSYCYIPFMLHFGLSEKQTSSFFQLCRIGGVSFDLENKFGTTFIILGTLKDTVGIITTAKDRRGMIKLVLKSAQFLIKQNSHNISTQMLKQKQQRMKQRLNINFIKERLEQL